MKQTISKKNLFIIILAGMILIGGSYLFLRGKTPPAADQPGSSSAPVLSLSPAPTPFPTAAPSGGEKPAAENRAALISPISRALERITKKPFGIKVSPKNSPVSPEKFTGYHAGTDFETFPEEENIDVPIYAVCGGMLIYKNWMKGYGGMAIQECAIGSEDVTVIYGHLKLSSIGAKEGYKFSAGEKIGNLGKGYSAETDGERKHLHLGIHKGQNVVFLGYVQNAKDLENWLDAAKYLK